MTKMGAFACILVFLVWVLFFVYENFNAFTSGIGKVKLISSFLKTIFFYFIVAGFWQNDNEWKKKVFLDKRYLELREQFRGTGTGVTNGGKVDAGGSLAWIVKERKQLLKNKFPKIKDNIKWEVYYYQNNWDRKVSLKNNIDVPWGWGIPPFPWKINTWFEHPPYSKEK